MPRLTLTLLLIIALGFARSLSAETKAKWIWRPQKQQGARETVCFRYDFHLPAAPVAGTVRFSGDDFYQIYINGHLVRQEKNFRCAPLKAESTFAAGHNTIAVQVENVTSRAGLLMFAEFTLPGEKAPRILVTDASWQWHAPFGENDLSWTKREADTSDWGRTDVVCDVDAYNSWQKHIRIEDFMTAEEIAERHSHSNSLQQEIQASIATVTAQLQTEDAPPAVRFERRNGLPFLTDGANEYSCPFYNAYYLDARKQEEFSRLRRFHEAGFRIFMVSAFMRDFWKPDGSVDTAEIEAKLLHWAAAAPEARFILSLDLVPPRWFLEAHPDEAIAYASGAKPVYDGDELTTPSLRASYASPLWKEMAGKALGAFVSRLSRSLPAKRIVAWHIGYGLYTEWHMYGMPREMPDVSRPMQEAFSQFLRERYATDTALQEAWKDPSVTLATARIPSPEQRLLRKDGQVFVPGMDRRVIDFGECMGRENMRCQYFFNRIVRQASPRNLPIGNYSGYFFGVNYPSSAWTLNQPDILNGEEVDFQCAPYCYAYRKTGNSGLPRGVLDSYPLHGKTAILESDARPHTSSSSTDRAATTQEETDGQLVRDFCNAMVHGAALWYYDFDAGWYDTPHTLSLFAKLRSLWEQYPDVSRVSEVCLACDFGSVTFHTSEVNPNRFTARLVGELGERMRHLGVPFDTLLTEDLALPSTRPYKVYVFPNLLHLTGEKQRLVDRLLEQGAYVVLQCEPPAAERWRGHPRVLFGENNTLTGEQLTELYKTAGVHRYLQEDAILFATRSLLAVHKTAPGRTVLTLPGTPSRVRQVFPEARDFPTTRQLVYEHPKAGTVLFHLEYKQGE